MDQPPTFIKALLTYFGLTASAAMQEMKQLNKEEREYFYNEMKKAGIECLPPGQSSIAS